MLHALDATPVLGVSLGHVCLLRLDRYGGPAPGNKAFKLEPCLLQAERAGIRRLVSFGGAWSNHLHALAAVGHERGFETVGVVRAHAHEPETPMLRDARRWGMRIVPVGREQYRRRNDSAFQEELEARFAPCLLLPEGGASASSAQGCRAIADLIRSCAPECRRIFIPVGTGTTLAGVAAGLDARFCVHGISALKGAQDLPARVQALLDEIAPVTRAQWRILQEFHCGGFARVDARLQQFMLAFEAVHRVPLEPVYTGKMLLAIHSLRESGAWPADEPVLAIHTGGLQGRRGYTWLS